MTHCKIAFLALLEDMYVTYKGWRFQVNSKQTWNCAKSVGWEDWDRIGPSNVGHLPEEKFQAIWLARR